MASRALVLDANILIRAVLGNRVRRILEKVRGQRIVLHYGIGLFGSGGDPAKALIMRIR
jgi:hypothetical protein